MIPTPTLLTLRPAQAFPGHAAPRQRASRWKPWLCAGLLALGARAQAHEFWLRPSLFAPAVGAPLSLSLSVGEQFEGSPVAFGSTVVAGLQLFTRTATQDLQALVPPGASQSELPLRFGTQGTHLLALDSRPYTIEMAADKFTAYLREEGLEAIVAQREAQGQTQAPGRERYRRHVKTLLRVGQHSDAAFGVRTGQTLEIVPRQDPTHALGRDLAFDVLFQGQPLQGALLKAWHQGRTQLTVLRARTNAEGRVTYRLPWAGVWMLSVVHMEPASDTPAIDWDSHWGNLTFETLARPR
ncbi:MAG: DUF4198 domain-containing protein [Burkholderiaceae bacterium]|nr:DUF4198 domain-containing protein [Burkholderiaceae bacterium]